MRISRATIALQRISASKPPVMVADTFWPFCTARARPPHAPLGFSTFAGNTERRRG